MNASQVNVIPDAAIRKYPNAPHFAHMLFHHQSMNDNASLRYGFRNAYAHWPARPQNIDMLYGVYDASLKENNGSIRNVIENLLAVKYIYALSSYPRVLDHLRANPETYQLKKEFPEFNATMWENLNWQSRVHFKHQAFVMKSEGNMFRGILNAKQIGFDPRKHVLLLKDKAYQEALAESPPQEASKKEWTPPEIVEESNNYIRILFKTNTSGYLVLADLFYPGWKAFNNGQPARILKANFLQRAVRIAPGTHEVIFRYEPESLRIGFICLAITFGLLLMTMGVVYKVRARV